MYNQLSGKNELSDKIKNELRFFGNLVWSCLSHPFENTLLDKTTGEIVGHYKPEQIEEVPYHQGYSIYHHLKMMYLIAKECVLHPTTPS